MVMPDTVPNTKKDRIFKHLLVGVVFVNLAFIALHWGTVLFMAITGAGILMLVLFPVLFIDSIVSAISVVVLLVLMLVFRPRAQYLLLGLLAAIILGGYGFFNGIPWYEMASEEAEERAKTSRVISREEGLRYFEQCRVHGIAAGDPLPDYSEGREERSGVGGLSVVPLEGEGGDSDDWLRSFDMKDYWAYQAANFANYGKCKTPVYPDDEGFQRVELDAAVSMLNQCQFTVVMYWTDDDSKAAYGFVWRVAEEFNGIAYGYESQPTVLFASEKMASPVREAAQRAKTTCDKLQIVENYPVSNFRRDL